jgi:hypothetical protein
MKTIRGLVLTTAFLLGFTGYTGIVAARVVRIWPYQELLEKSDLVVLATPTATNDTQEHIDLPGFVGEHVIGLETRFAVSAVLKGDKTLRNFVFHHYRTTYGPNIAYVPNGPTFVSFDPVDPVASPTIPARTFILFLVREADGRYAPIAGQTDPGGGIRELRGGPA